MQVYNWNQKCILKDRAEFTWYIEKRGFTQHTLAAACDVHYTTINYIVLGKRNPSLELAKKLAELLKVDFNDLFTFEKRKRREQ